MASVDFKNPFSSSAKPTPTLSALRTLTKYISPEEIAKHFIEKEVVQHITAPFITPLNNLKCVWKHIELYVSISEPRPVEMLLGKIHKAGQILVKHIPVQARQSSLQQILQYKEQMAQQLTNLKAIQGSVKSRLKETLTPLEKPSAEAQFNGKPLNIAFEDEKKQFHTLSAETFKASMIAKVMEDLFQCGKKIAGGFGDAVKPEELNLISYKLRKVLSKQDIQRLMDESDAKYTKRSTAFKDVMTNWNSLCFLNLELNAVILGIDLSMEAVNLIKDFTQELSTVFNACATLKADCNNFKTINLDKLHKGYGELVSEISKLKSNQNTNFEKFKSELDNLAKTIEQKQQLSEKDISPFALKTEEMETDIKTTISKNEAKECIKLQTVQNQLYDGWNALCLQMGKLDTDSTFISWMQTLHPSNTTVSKDEFENIIALIKQTIVDLQSSVTEAILNKYKCLWTDSNRLNLIAQFTQWRNNLALDYIKLIETLTAVWSTEFKETETAAANELATLKQKAIQGLQKLLPSHNH